MLRDEHPSTAQLYPHIVRLLVLLGMYRPAKSFWGTLVATLQWSTGIDMAYPYAELWKLKRLYYQCRATSPTPADLPVNYPDSPTTLLETHPAIYHRVYVGPQQPTQPPETLDRTALLVLKVAAGREHSSRQFIPLETRLGLGRLCP